MKLLRVHMKRKTATAVRLPDEWLSVGGSGLIARIMNGEAPPGADPLGPENRLIFACGPLAGTMAPQLGRISVGAKSPLTLGIKEANAGGPAGQYLDRLGFRAIIVEDAPSGEELFYLVVSMRGAELVPAGELRGMKNYELARLLRSRHGRRTAVICTGIAGERRYRGASVSFTDIFGDPSRNAARGGLGAVMGSKGLKAVVLDPAGAPRVEIAHREEFRRRVRDWVRTLGHDIGCALFSRFGTPFAVANSANQGTMPTNNYRSGRPRDFHRVSGEAVQEILFERGGRMHACMPGCVVRCSIIYPDEKGTRLASAYEYETIAMLGTNLGIMDLDSIARLKFMCDDLGLDAVETGSALGVAAEAGEMEMGDPSSAMKLLLEIEKGTTLGEVLGNGVVSTADLLNVTRVPAYRGQALPAHDPRAVKGTGVTYLTSPMGADHTAGLTYRAPRGRENQARNSLRAQVQAAVCDTFGYCLNAVPGGRASIYDFLAGLTNARYGKELTPDHVVEIGKQTLKDQIRFNHGAEFASGDWPSSHSILSEPLTPTGQVFDVPEGEIKEFWKALDGFRVQAKQWEVRIPPMPEVLFGVNVVRKLGPVAARLGMKRPLIVSDPGMEKMGRVGEVVSALRRVHVSPSVFSDVEPDPSVGVIDSGAAAYRAGECDGVVGLGGGSSLDAAKAIGLRVSHDGELTEYESIVGGTAKIGPVLPPLICIPTTAGTGSEVNPYAVITNRERQMKFMLMSNHLIPRTAVVDPVFTKSMPPSLTAESGIDALAHCIEGYVALGAPYHPYFESMGLYGVKLIGRSLVKAYRDGEDLDARTDMCMAALYGGIAFSKGLGVGHALAHVLGSRYHIPHGRAATIGLICFVRANIALCEREFTELAFMLNRSRDLEQALLSLYREMGISPTLKGNNVPEEDLERIAFFTCRDAVNMATNPARLTEGKVLSLLRGVYE